MLLLANTIMHCKPVHRYSIRTFYTNAYYRTVQCIAKPNILIRLYRNNLGCFLSYSLNDIIYGTKHYCIIIQVNSHVSAEIHPPPPHF